MKQKIQKGQVSGCWLPTVYYKQSEETPGGLMGLLIGVYSSQQDLVSDDLALLCIDECRLVVNW